MSKNKERSEAESKSFLVTATEGSTENTTDAHPVPQRVLTISITLSGGTEDEQNLCAYDIRTYARKFAKRDGLGYSDMVEDETY